jgi:hypothetical protein
MRLLFVGSVILALASTGLTSSVAARNASYSMCLCHYGYGNVHSDAVECDATGGRCSARKVSYSMCHCHYGYGNVCSIAVECDATGGRCRGPCGAPALQDQ